MTKIYNIITESNPNLRKKSKKIDLLGINKPEFQEFLRDMKATMLKRDGVGLAAPQIDKQIRVIIVNTKDGPVAMINPVITKKSWRQVWGEEGCLSVPKTFGEVRRRKGLVCEYYNEKGEKKSIEASGLMARIIQHELDHLDGVLFVDLARKIKRIE